MRNGNVLYWSSQSAASVGDGEFTRRDVRDGSSLPIARKMSECIPRSHSTYVALSDSRFRRARMTMEKSASESNVTSNRSSDVMHEYCDRPQRYPAS